MAVVQTVTNIPTVVPMITQNVSVHFAASTTVANQVLPIPVLRSP